MSSLSRFFLLFLNTFFISQLTIGQTPTVTLSLSDAFINENGGTSSLTATLSNQSGQDVVINLSLSGSATASSDFTISQASITISPGDLSGSVVLTGIDDALNEVDETIIISIQSLSNGLEDGDQQVTATVVDDEILDAAVTRVISPDSRVLITANTVEIEVSNPGTEVLANVLLTLEVDFNGVPLGSATGTFAGPLNPGSTDSFIFTAATFDFSADGLYEIRAATTLLGDENTSNDVATREVVNLVAILPPVREGFEFIGPETTFEGEDRPVINGLPGWSYEQTGGSRLRSLQGFILRNHASLDNPGGDGVNTLTLNVDLSEFSLASGPRVSLYFSWFDHGEESDPEDRLSFRTHEDDPFIELYDFAANGVRGSLINVRNISINDALAANGLGFTSTFQLRFQQSDNFPINSDGISIDNVFLGVEIPGSPVSTNLTVAENVPLGSSMGSGLINDGSAIYTIANNVLAGLFEVNEVTLEVTTISSLDFESIVTDMGTNVFDFDVEVTDVVFGGSVVMPIQITVTDLNEAPVFDLPANPNQTVRENAGPQVVAGFASNMGDGDAGTQALTFNLSNDNNNLFSVQPSIDENTGDIIYTPAPNTNGSATVTVSLSDDGGTTNGGDDTSDEQTFTITVTAVNNAPSFALGRDQDVLEDAGTQTVDGFATSISPGSGADELGQTLTFTVSNDNNSLFDEQPSIDANTGGLTYTTAANANGMATVTVSLSDDGGTADGGEDTSGEQTFTITVTAVNDAPVFVLGDDQDVLEDAGAQIVDGFVTSIGPGGEADELGQALTFTISNDNNSLFNEQPSIDANTGSLTYTAVADANGVATVMVSLSDDGGITDGGEDTSGEQTFTITLSAVNDAPGFVLGDDQHILEDVGAQTVNDFATSISPGSGADELGQALTFTVSNDNNSLFNEQPSIDANTGGLTYTTAADANGMATVTVSLSDDGGTTDGGEDTSGEQTFTITVAAVNDAPVFVLGDDQDVLEDAGAQIVDGFVTSIAPGGEADELGQTLTFTISNDNNSLFNEQPSIDANTGGLTYTTAADANGMATVTVSLSDDGGITDGGEDTSGEQTFTITLSAVNDAPGFVLGDDQHILEDVGAQTVNAFATSISPGGGADELGQALTFNVSNDNNSLFNEQPSIDANTGGLTYTTAADANGMATVTVSLSDDGGTTDGGEDTSGEQTFTITATPINDAPFLDPIADVTIDANTNELQVVNLSGISAGAANENQGIVLSASANIPNLLSNLSIDYTSPDQEGTLTFSVNRNVSAVVEVSVLINDNGGTQDGGIDENMVTFTVNIDQVITNQLFLPTLFSPNGDLTNDRFIVRGNANISMVEFSIFDRDGNEVFNSASWPQLSRDGWDGSSKGTDQPQGVYIWVVRGSFSDGSPLLINGQDTGSIRLTR